MQYGYRPILADFEAFETLHKSSDKNAIIPTQ